MTSLVPLEAVPAETPEPAPAVARILPFVYGGAVLVLASLLVLYPVFQQRLPVIAWLLLHVAGVASLLQAARACEDRRDRDALLWAALWFGLASVFGLIVYAVSSMRVGARSVADEDAVPGWLSSPDATSGGYVPAESLVDRLCRDIRDNRVDFTLSEPVVSLYDCMETGTQQEQLNALRVIANDYDSDFAPILQAATVSRDMAVRVMAATVMAKLRKRFADAIDDAERRLALDAEDPQRRRVLGEACLAYVHSGLLGDELAQHYHARALALVGASTTAVLAPPTGDA